MTEIGNAALASNWNTAFDQTTYAWLDSISDTDLYMKLTTPSDKDLELLTFIGLEGHGQHD